ncbi:MAG: hypothetical protein DRN81_05100 [Thermoproteota archaeon]|nr:MAG: hypothetical protein DRN81_05100 [Candidatus Korarchaeota archaeon]
MTVYGVELRKVDGQGRIVIPSDWRSRELGEDREVFVIKFKGYLKIVPRKRTDLTKYFDSVDLGFNVDDWEEFERRFYEVS